MLTLLMLVCKIPLEETNRPLNGTPWRLSDFYVCTRSPIEKDSATKRLVFTRMKAQRESRLFCQTFHESPDLARIAKDENSRAGGVSRYR